VIEVRNDREAYEGMKDDQIRETGILIIKGHEVERLLLGNETRIVSTVRRAYEIHGQGKSSLPHSVFLRFPEQEKNRIIALPAYLGGDFDVAGVKWVSSFPSNLRLGLNRASAIIVLNSTETGLPETILEGSWISAKRTAASAALAARQFLSNATATATGIIGCGLINFEVVRFLQALKTGGRNITAFDIEPGRAKTFRRKCSSELPGTTVEISNDVDSILRNCDLVSIATTATEPHITDISAFRPGATILHVSLRDLSPNVILNCDNVVDDIDHVCRAQTSIHLTEQQVGNRDFIACALPEALLGKRFSRKSDKGVLVFSPFGLGILDLALATLTRDLALRDGCGERIEGFLP
jgi:N-[(2S)-2-amino-2-carboxyethyl]-L-glutamate dehydrogenase